MRLLIDTHALIWYVDQDHLLSALAHSAITNPSNDLLLSAASIWEVAIKVALQKLTLSQPYRAWMNQALADVGVAILLITVESAATMSTLPFHHRDPFDRLPIAQAQVEGLVLVSADAQLDACGVNRLW